MEKCYRFENNLKCATVSIIFDERKSVFQHFFFHSKTLFIGIENESNGNERIVENCRDRQVKGRTNWFEQIPYLPKPNWEESQKVKLIYIHKTGTHSKHIAVDQINLELAQIEWRIYCAHKIQCGKPWIELELNELFCGNAVPLGDGTYKCNLFDIMPFFFFSSSAMLIVISISIYLSDWFVCERVQYSCDVRVPLSWFSIEWIVGW